MLSCHIGTLFCVFIASCADCSCQPGAANAAHSGTSFCFATPPNWQNAAGLGQQGGFNVENDLLHGVLLGDTLRPTQVYKVAWGGPFLCPACVPPRVPGVPGWFGAVGFHCSKGKEMDIFSFAGPSHSRAACLFSANNALLLSW